MLWHRCVPGDLQPSSLGQWDQQASDRNNGKFQTLGSIEVRDLFWDNITVCKWAHPSTLYGFHAVYFYWIHFIGGTAEASTVHKTNQKQCALEQDRDSFTVMARIASRPCPIPALHGYSKMNQDFARILKLPRPWPGDKVLWLGDHGTPLLFLLKPGVNRRSVISTCCWKDTTENFQGPS